MHKTIFLLLISITLSNIFSFSENLAPVMVDGKWGYIDKSGRTVIEPQYDYANWFWEGLAAVKKGEKYGYINPQNQLVIPFRYDYTFSFSDGLGMIEMDGKAGYINKSGAVVIPIEYAQAFDFYKGIGPVQDAEGRIFFIDKKGEKVDKPFLSHLIIAYSTKSVMNNTVSPPRPALSNANPDSMMYEDFRKDWLP